MHSLYIPLKKWALILTVLASLLILTSSLALAQTDSRVTLQSSQGPNNTLIVEVLAENVTDLYGAEFKLKFDPAVMTVQDVDPDNDGIQIETGSFLPASQGFVVVNQVDAIEGTVSYALTLLNPAPAVSGTGPLARVTFNIEQDLPATIQIEKAKLVAADLQTIPVETLALSVGNGEPEVVTADQPIEAAASGADNQPQAQAETTTQVQVQPETLAESEPQPQIDPLPEVELQPQAEPQPQVETQPETQAQPVANLEATSAAPGSEFPWWIIALGILVMGFTSLGAFAIAGGMKNPQQGKPAHSHPQLYQHLHSNSQTTQPAHSRKHVTGTRPSAFKK